MSGLNLNDGTTVACNVVVIGIGVQPNIELADAAHLPCDNGILVDEFCRTDNPDIYAIGDCTNHPNPILGKRLRLECVPNAMDQARVAASNIVGRKQAYESVPWFWSDQYDMKFQMAGFANESLESIRGGTSAINRSAFSIWTTNAGRDGFRQFTGEFLIARRLVRRLIALKNSGMLISIWKSWHDDSRRSTASKTYFLDNQKKLTETFSSLIEIVTL